MKNKSLFEIADVIRADWKKVYFGALPYLDALGTLDDITDSYGCDSARSIVAYLLSNCSSWTGPTAREVKKELNARLKSARG